MANADSSLEPVYVKFEREWRDSARKALTKAQWNKLAGAIVDYYLDEEEPELPENAKRAFEFLRPQLDYKRRKSIEQLVRNQEKKPPRIAEFLPEDQHDSEMVSPENLGGKISFTCTYDANHCALIDTDKVINSPSSRTGAGSGSGDVSAEITGARTPTLDEVRTYCEACGLAVSPVKFYNYYEASGWRDKGGKPIANWRGKLLAWNMREGNFPTSDQSMPEVSKPVRREAHLTQQAKTGGKGGGMWQYVNADGGLFLLEGSEGLGREDAQLLLDKLVAAGEV